MRPDFNKRFPKFASLISNESLIEVLLPLGDHEIEALEAQLHIPLPNSYKNFLKISRGFWIDGRSIRFEYQHPFFHPSPSRMLCFAEYFLEGDGDQVLFKTDKGLQNGEYAVYYYAHDGPPSVRKIADSFDEWLENHCLQDMNHE